MQNFYQISRLIDHILCVLQVENEVSLLRKQLKESQSMVKKLQSCIVKEKVHSNHVISMLKMKLQHDEDVRKKQQQHSDQQMSEVLSHLLFLEGKVKKEQINVRKSLQNKDEIINRQGVDIATLNETNHRLVTVLQEHYYGDKNRNGIINDPCENDSFEDEEPCSPKSPKHKSMFGFSLSKDKSKRTRSTLDLHEGEVNIKQGLVRRRQYYSQENLMSIGRKTESRESRDKKCRTVGGFPDSSFAELIPEVMDENDSRLSSLANLSNSSDLEERNSDGAYKMNGHTSSSKAKRLSANSMPTLNHAGEVENFKTERPKSIASISSVENIYPDKSSQKEPKRPKSPTLSTTSHSESSNPFKNLKTILKRKGSKSKNKKRSVTMADSPGGEYEEAMKKHFEKYDMS